MTFGINRARLVKEKTMDINEIINNMMQAIDAEKDMALFKAGE